MNTSKEEFLHLIFCPTCGAKRKLVDQKAKAERVGLTWPESLPIYTIECCGNQLTISDNEVYQKVIAVLLRGE